MKHSRWKTTGGKGSAKTVTFAQGIFAILCVFPQAGVRNTWIWESSLYLAVDEHTRLLRQIEGKVEKGGKAAAQKAAAQIVPEFAQEAQALAPCCDKASRTSCTCVLAHGCPEHGETHVGAHKEVPCAC